MILTEYVRKKKKERLFLHIEYRTRKSKTEYQKVRSEQFCEQKRLGRTTLD